MNWLRAWRQRLAERTAAGLLREHDYYAQQAEGWRALAERYWDQDLKSAAFEARCWAEKHKRKQAKLWQEFTLAKARCV